MFDKLGLGWGNSLLAFVALGLGIVYPIFLWYYVSTNISYEFALSVFLLH